jgi:D-alanine-D-alanine ligase-like ATP-grasp enzyme
MNTAFVFVESKVFLPMLRRAKLTKDQGHRNYLIFRPLEDWEAVRLAQFEQEFCDGEKLFDGIQITEKFDLETLRRLNQDIEQDNKIQGYITVTGLFGPDGLLGAHVATLAEERGIPSQGTDALYRSNNKFLMRDALRAANVPTVDFGMATDEDTLLAHARRIGYPLILKPVTGIASHLIMKCRDDQELVSNFRLALEKMPGSYNDEVYKGDHEYPTKAGEKIYFEPMRSMLLESYIDGREASVEVVVTETEVVPLLVHDKVKVTETARVFYEHLLVVPPVRFTDEEVQAMKDYAVACVKALGLKNSLCHVELRYCNKTGPQVLEVNPRVGGMMVVDSLQTMIGFEAVPAMVELAQGTFTPAASYPSKSELHAMFTLYPPHAGVFTGIEGFEELQQLPGMLRALLTMEVGARIYGDDEEVFLVMCWMRGECYEHIVETYEKACEMVKLEVEPFVAEVQA